MQSMKVTRDLVHVTVCVISITLITAQDYRSPTLAIGQWCNCGEDYRPVCGSDGNTYNNECYLYCATSHGGHNGRECIRYKDGRDYKGKQSTTEDGRRCTPWENNVGIYPLSDQIRYDPITASNFPDRSLQEARNYCRNPDKDPRGLWCFTGNGDPYSFGACSVPSCGNNNRECVIREDGRDYAGTTATTQDGRRCTPWINNVGIYPLSFDTPVDPITDGNFPDRSVFEARNYCRNPDGDKRGPWCFTGYGEPFNYGVCDIPTCNGNNNNNINDLYKLHDGPCTGTDTCEDSQEYAAECTSWKYYGFCQSRSEFMSIYCKRTCGFCQEETNCQDSYNYKDRCPGWVKRGHCLKEKTFMFKNCRDSCGWCNNGVCKDNLLFAVTCPMWARVGFCQSSREFMIHHCRKSCNAC